MNHATPRCPDLDESFPFLPTGWRADREDDEGGSRSSNGKRRLIWGGGLVSRISNDYEPHLPVFRDDVPGPVAREVVDYRVDAVRHMEPGSGHYGIFRNGL